MTKEYARYLYDIGEMPYWIYASHYATNEERIILAEQRKREMINTVIQQRAEKEKQSRLMREQQKQIEQDVQNVAENAINELMKKFKQ